MEHGLQVFNAFIARHIFHLFPPQLEFLKYLHLPPGDKISLILSWRVINPPATDHLSLLSEVSRELWALFSRLKTQQLISYHTAEQKTRALRRDMSSPFVPSASAFSLHLFYFEDPISSHLISPILIPHFSLPCIIWRAFWFKQCQASLVCAVARLLSACHSEMSHRSRLWVSRGDETGSLAPSPAPESKYQSFIVIVRTIRRVSDTTAFGIQLMSWKNKRLTFDMFCFKNNRWIPKFVPHCLYWGVLFQL